MPELPEVEVCRRGLLPRVEGCSICTAVVRVTRLRRDLPEGLAETLAGRHIASIMRRGKYLLFDCRGADGNGWLIIHLGMSGNLRFVPHGTPAGRHDHFDLVLPETVLRLTDPRRFGVVDWYAGDDPYRHPLLVHLGIEPLSPEFTADWLYSALKRRQAPVKNVLMDARTIVGVGNIYASESLFRAGISPVRAANLIGREQCSPLVQSIRGTLMDAIAAGGSSIRDYMHSDGGSGYFQLECAVYGRDGQPCKGCGQPVQQVRQAGRATYFCPRCQR